MDDAKGPPKKTERQAIGSPIMRLPLARIPFDAKQARAYQEAWATHVGVGVEVENSVGIDLILVPPAKFKQMNGTQPFYWVPRRSLKSNS